MSLTHASRNQAIWILIQASMLMLVGAAAIAMHLLKIRDPEWVGDMAYYVSMGIRFLIFTGAFVVWCVAAIRFFRPFQTRAFGTWIFFVMVVEMAVMSALFPRVQKLDTEWLSRSGTPEVATLRRTFAWDAPGWIVLGVLTLNLILLWIARPPMSNKG